MKPEQNGGHFADDIFICIFFFFLIKELVQSGNRSALTWEIAWDQTGSKPLADDLAHCLIHTCIHFSRDLNMFTVSVQFSRTLAVIMTHWHIFSIGRWYFKVQSKKVILFLKFQRNLTIGVQFTIQDNNLAHFSTVPTYETRATVTPRNPSADRSENGVLNQWATSRISDLMSYVSHKQTRPRSWLKVRPYQVGLRLEKKCTRESGNRLRRSIN